MSFMFEVYYKPPANPAKETAVADHVASLGGRLVFHEEGVVDGLDGVCLTYEFDDLGSAWKAAGVLRQLGEYVEGPVEYGS